MAGDVEKILKVLVAGTEQGPDRACPLVDVLRFSLPSVITQECSVQTGVCVLHQLHLQHTNMSVLLLVFYCTKKLYICHKFTVFCVNLIKNINSGNMNKI